jgi:hypothetical protein
LAPVGALAFVTTEVPLATLNVRVATGNYQKQDGTIGQYAGSSSQTMTASATNYLYLDLTNSGNLVVNTTGFPATAHVRLATVVAAVSTITSITDARVAFKVIGAFADGVNLTFGTLVGTQNATAANQKLAFFGKTPVVQPTMGAATAGTRLHKQRTSDAQRSMRRRQSFGAGKLAKSSAAIRVCRFPICQPWAASLLSGGQTHPNFPNCCKGLAEILKEAGIAQPNLFAVLYFDDCLFKLQWHRNLWTWGNH